MISLICEQRKAKILNQQFWDAYLYGKYPSDTRDTISFKIEKFEQILGKLGYMDTKYIYNYEINIVAIKEIFFISIHTLASDSKILGVAHYYTRRKIYEIKYFSGLMEENPIALRLLNRIKFEMLSKGIELEEKKFKKGNIPFEGAIKAIVCIAHWRSLLTTRPNLKPEERAEIISKIVDMHPNSVASYARNDLDKDTRSDASKSYQILSEVKYNITERWLKLKQKDFSPVDIAKTIAEEFKISPLTVALYGKVSKDKIVRSESLKVIPIMLDSRYNITDKWRHLINSKSKKSPKEKAELIAQDLNLNPISVASYANYSEDVEVRREAKKSYNILCDLKHNITEKWSNLINKFPPEEIAKIIALNLNLNPQTVAQYGKYSKEPEIKNEASKACANLADNNFNIIEKWRELIISSPKLSPIEKAKVLSDE